ncbi:MAG: lytic transglycosylase domain-containing protein [Spirochaetaceae bacterium]
MGRNTIRRSTVTILFSITLVAGIALQAQEALPTRHVPDGSIAIGISMIDHPLVAEYIARYSSQAGLRGIQSSLDAAVPFRRHIIETLRDAGIPDQLFFVALIESGFDPYAVSRSGAVGIWQFMDHSIEDWMVINGDVDERRDFYRSTRGAVEKLRNNYLIFGDWMLAIAAYNAGVGHIQRALTDTDSLTYRDLLETDALSQETRSYVPRFIAVSQIVSQAGRHGLVVPWDQSPEWTRLPLPAHTGIVRVSQESGVPITTLLEWNPHFRQSTTSTGTEEPGYLNVPVAYRHRFNWLLE